MSAPEPPVGSIWRTAAGSAIQRHAGAGWFFAGGEKSYEWEALMSRYGPLFEVYTPPALTLVERMSAVYHANGDATIGFAMQAALAEVAAWVEEQSYLLSTADTLTYRDALLAALRAEAGR